MRLFLFAALAVSAVPAFAGTNICWFDHVSTDGDRLVLHFSPTASLGLWGQGRSYFVRNGMAHESNGKGLGAAVEIVLAPGESMSGSTIPEDSCTYEVSERDGKRGLLITASSHVSGYSTSATAFLIPE